MVTLENILEMIWKHTAQENKSPGAPKLRDTAPLMNVLLFQEIGQGDWQSIPPDLSGSTEPFPARL